jgi:hypothetical protein
MKAIKQILLIVCVSILTYVAVMTLGSAYKANMARAHSDGHQLYDADCCNQIDCAPVTKIEIVPQSRVHAGLGLLPQTGLPSTTLITTIHGTVAIPPNLDPKARRQSRDHRMHACIRQTAGGLKLICLYDQPGI